MRNDSEWTMNLIVSILWEESWVDATIVDFKSRDEKGHDNLEPVVRFSLDESIIEVFGTDYKIKTKVGDP